jgi:hypothetical protein
VITGHPERMRNITSKWRQARISPEQKRQTPSRPRILLEKFSPLPVQWSYFCFSLVCAGRQASSCIRLRYSLHVGNRVRTLKVSTLEESGLIPGQPWSSGLEQRAISPADGILRYGLVKMECIHEHIHEGRRLWCFVVGLNQNTGARHGLPGGVAGFWESSNGDCKHQPCNWTTPQDI